MPTSNLQDSFFPAYKKTVTTNQTFASGSFQAITINGIIFDNFDHMNSSSQMLCKKAGFYRVGCLIRVAYNGTATFSAIVKVEGNVIGVDTRLSNPSVNPVNLYVDVPTYLDSGQVVEFSFFHNVGSNMTLVRDTMSPHFWMHMTGQAA